MADFAAMNAVYGRFVPGPAAGPLDGRVAALPKGVKVEIEVVAYRRTVDAVAR